MSKKLYEVHVEFTYYAFSNNERDAICLVSEAFADEYKQDIASATEIADANGLIECPGNALVYGPKEDVTMDAALLSIGLPRVDDMNKLFLEKLKRKAEGVKP